MSLPGSKHTGGRMPEVGRSPEQPLSMSTGVIGNDTVKLTIPSENWAVREVQDQVMHAVERHGFDAQSQFAIKLALEEALINAIKHGNRLDPHKRVHVQYKVTADQAEMIIEDEGPGFNRKSVPDPTLEENIEKCSGRGILLIEAYMTSVRWTRGGRRLRMTRRNVPATPGQ